MIRPVAASDAKAWAVLRHALWPDADPGELANEAHSFVEGCAVTAVTAAFIAADETSALGFLELSVRPFADGCDSTPVPHIEAWYVAPAARGRGIGRALMEAAETWSRTHGFTELASDTEVKNEQSIQAHVRCGFTETERLVKFRKPILDPRTSE